MLIRNLTVALTCLSISLISTAKTESSVDNSVRYVPAKRIFLKRATYPKSQIKKSNAGMVEIGYMVDKTGKPSELVILESSHSDFEAPALKAVEKYNFKPALYYGVPRESFHTVRLLFQGKQKAAVLPEFAMAFREIQALLEQKESNSELISQQIDNLRDQGMLNPYATTQVNKLSYLHSKRFGTAEHQISTLKAMLLYQGRSGNNGRFLDDKTAVIAYQELFNLYLAKGDYSGANSAYNRLWNIDSKFRDIYRETADELDEISKDNRAFEMPLTIVDRGYASISLWKRKFSFFDVQGKFTALKLRCELKFAELPFQSESLYETPEGWGSCNLQLIGDNGAKVTIIQQ